MNKTLLRNKVFNFLGSFDPKILTKFRNISGKTRAYNVPLELYQKRTNRKNRVLISWKTVKANDLTIEQLNTFVGGVVVEFVNEDYFEPNNQNDPLFIELKNRLGSDENVSSIISIRSESGSSSSFVQRQAFQQLINNTVVRYKDQKVCITADNYLNYAIKQEQKGGMGNDKWSGFLFISIKGGQQDVIISHKIPQTFFNPACEYANRSVSTDIDLVLSYFAMLSIDIEMYPEKSDRYHYLINALRATLKEIKYNNPSYTGDLLEYCENHPSVRMVPGKLYDPIQVVPIHIKDFAIDNKEDERNLDLTHDEAVNKDKYYWDTINNCILSSARPTNVFWSRHLSNMMQQNFTLEEFFAYEEDIVRRRKELLGDNLGDNNKKDT